MECSILKIRVQKMEFQTLPDDVLFLVNFICFKMKNKTFDKNVYNTSSKKEKLKQHLKVPCGKQEALPKNM